ncbi:hypothetical protein [Streptomyces sp. NPDC051576]|uniref:hypothetical protein n=1 Tax=Streptomyces sp. NPDC051576 TaxID=3155803 RepID=UPI00341376A7
MEHRGVTAIRDLVCEETWWVRKEKFRADRHVAGNVYRFTRLYLLADREHVLVDIEDAAVIGRVLMSNAVAHSGVSEHAVIPVTWALLQSGALVIQVHDRIRDFPDFDDAMEWEPSEDERPRGLWTARQRGAEIAYALTEGGKVVQALIKPRALPA